MIQRPGESLQGARWGHQELKRRAAWDTEPGSRAGPWRRGMLQLHRSSRRGQSDQVPTDGQTGGLTVTAIQVATSNSGDHAKLIPRSSLMFPEVRWHGGEAADCSDLLLAQFYFVLCCPGEDAAACVVLVCLVSSGPGFLTWTQYDHIFPSHLQKFLGAALRSHIPPSASWVELDRWVSFLPPSSHWKWSSQGPAWRPLFHTT